MSAACPVFGVTVRAELRPESDAHSQLERFHELLASRGLVCAGGSGRTWDLVVSSEAGQMTEGDRQAVAEWLAAEPGLGNVRVTELGDLSDESLTR